MKAANKRIVGCLMLLGMAGNVIAGSVDWAHQSGKQNNNGSITVKSVQTPGSTYTTTQNPTGTAVKVNQSAATQPPLVIIQNSGVNRWSMYYADRAQGLP